MKRARTVWAGGAIAAALAVFSLGGTASGSRAIEAAAPTRDQLPIMVLPGDVLGAEARAFEVDIGAGFTDNTAAAEATLDPDDAAWQLRRLGRIVGYDLSYSDLSLTPLVRGSGLLGIGTSVDLFRRAPAADEFISRQLRDARRLRGRLVEYGRLTASSTFAPGPIGHRNAGLRTVVAAGKPIYTTLVAFRAGSVVASVSVVRTDPTSARTLAVRLARALAARIRLVGRDELDAQPVAVPPVGRAGRRPSEGPDLAAMALSRGDLPAATVLRQGYVADRDSLASYERELGSSPTPSSVSTVESDLNLLRHARESAGILRAARIVYSSRDIPLLIAAWTDLPSVTVEQRPAVSAGDESTALVFRFPALGTELRAAIVHVRVGRVLGTLRVIGSTSLRFADVRPLAQTLAKRIRGGL